MTPYNEEELLLLKQALDKGEKLPNKPFSIAVKEAEGFEHLLTAEALAVYTSFLPTKSFTFPEKGGGWSRIQCQFLGTVLKGGPHDDLLTQEKMRPLAETFNRAVREGLVGWGCLCKAVFIPLATIDTTKRGMLLVYTFSDLTREQLNERLGGEHFVEEGSTLGE